MTTSRRIAEDEAYFRIKRSIILRRLLPGQQLSEEWLGTNLKMSRTPIRTALKKLAQEKLIDIIPHRGAFVAQPTQKEIKEVFEVRILLESYAARKAALHISSAQLQKLKYYAEQGVQAYKNRDFELSIESNHRFHEMISISTGNQCLIDEVSSLITRGDCFVILQDPFYTVRFEEIRSISEHEDIVIEIESRNPDGAEAAVRRHLESILELYLSQAPSAVFE